MEKLQKLLAHIDEIDMALQSDLEHGVKCLNERAADEFTRNYPELNKWIAELQKIANEG